MRKKKSLNLWEDLHSVIHPSVCRCAGSEISQERRAVSLGLRLLELH